MAEHGQALNTGTLLQEFRIKKVLGAGGFGIAYLAHDTKLEIEVAIKEYLPIDLAIRTSSDIVVPRVEHNRKDFDDGLNAFLDEARLLEKFNHPNIVKVIRLFLSNGTAYIVMEYAGDRTLEDAITELNLLNEEDVLFILNRLSKGLKLLHQQNIFHRDIKPENIILQDDGNPILIDFGAASQVIGTKTRSIATMVTAGYAPIEQYDSNSKRLGAWTDIYALAATAYTSLTGKVIDSAPNRVEEDELIPAVKAAASRGSPAFLAAIDQGLAVFSRHRPQSLEEWWALLDPEQVIKTKGLKGKDAYIKVTITKALAEKGGQQLVTYQGKQFKVKIPTNSKSRMQLKLAGKGEASQQGGDNGDLFVEFIIKKKLLTPKNGANIYRNLDVLAVLAQKGGQAELKLNDKPIRVTIPRKCLHEQQLTLEGKAGNGENGGRSGDLIVTIKIIQPTIIPIDGDNIYHTQSISAELASEGGELEVLGRFLSIPAHIKEGESLTFSGKGETGTGGGRTGHLILTFNIEQDAVIEGDDIRVIEYISAYMAAEGGHTYITKNGKDYKLKIPKNTQEDSYLRLKGQGEQGENGGSHGDLIVNIQVLEEDGFAEESSQEEDSSEQDGDSFSNAFALLFSFEGRLSRGGFWAFFVFFAFIQLWPIVYLFADFQLEWVEDYFFFLEEQLAIIFVGALYIPWPVVGLFSLVFIEYLESGINADVIDVLTGEFHFFSALILHIAIFNVLLLWPSLAVQTKRLHDIGISGKKTWLHLFPPLLGSFKLLYLQGFREGDFGGNEYGEDPLWEFDSLWERLVNLLSLIVAILLAPILLLLTLAYLLVKASPVFAFLYAGYAAYQGDYGIAAISLFIALILVGWLYGEE
ncbi:MAG: protein kinase [Methyloprofundus sp.]|nr:protein kinase [Methyloprofundus sp.]